MSAPSPDALRKRFRRNPSWQTLRAMEAWIHDGFYWPLRKKEWMRISVRLGHLLTRRERVLLWRLQRDLRDLHRKGGQRSEAESTRLRVLSACLEELQSGV